MTNPPWSKDCEIQPAIGFNRREYTAVARDSDSRRRETESLARRRRRNGKARCKLRPAADSGEQQTGAAPNRDKCGHKQNWQPRVQGFLCLTSKMSHDGDWRGACASTTRDKPWRWLWRLVRHLGRRATRIDQMNRLELCPSRTQCS